MVGLILRNDRESEDYYKKGILNDNRHTYALGTLLFKILFGFVPFEKKRDFNNFRFNKYASYLDREENKKFLKVYAYADGLLDLSQQAKELIEESLDGKMTL